MTGSLCSLPLNSFRHDRLHWVVNENSISPTSAIHDRQIQPDHWMAAMGSSSAAAMPLNQRPQWPINRQTWSSYDGQLSEWSSTLRTSSQSITFHAPFVQPTPEKNAVLGGGDLKIRRTPMRGNATWVGRLRPWHKGPACTIRVNTADDCYGRSIISCVISARFESGPGRR